ncbi:MAG: hypothetical protein PHU23_14940 [Dehalococcoidales bacterium]|nr:hypothetical protein [Dehalococcoidales bacterium]
MTHEWLPAMIFWESCYEQDAETAREFGRGLFKAAEIADDMNDMNKVCMERENVEPGSYKKAKGVLTWTDSEMPEDIIRRM